MARFNKIQNIAVSEMLVRISFIFLSLFGSFKVAIRFSWSFPGAVLTKTCYVTPGLSN